MGFLKSSVHVNKVAIGNLDFNLMSTKNKFATLAKLVYSALKSAQIVAKDSGCNDLFLVL